jgi:hypothetical protein
VFSTFTILGSWHLSVTPKQSSRKKLYVHEIVAPISHSDFCLLGCHRECGGHPGPTWKLLLLETILESLPDVLGLPQAWLWCLEPMNSDQGWGGAESQGLLAGGVGDCVISLERKCKCDIPWWALENNCWKSALLGEKWRKLGTWVVREGKIGTQKFLQFNKFPSVWTGWSIRILRNRSF